MCGSATSSDGVRARAVKQKDERSKPEVNFDAKAAGSLSRLLQGDGNAFGVLELDDSSSDEME